MNTILILDDKFINFDKIIYIYMVENDIIDIYGKHTLYKIKAKLEDVKDDIVLFETKDKDEVIEKSKYLLQNLKDVQKIFLN